MKITPEHYEHMRSAMAAALAKRPGMIEEYARLSLSDKRFRWDLWRAAGLLRWTCDTIYPYANDDHIDTALRAIVRSLTEKSEDIAK